MKVKLIAAVAMFSLATTTTAFATVAASAKDTYVAAKKAAAVQYADDKEICAEETESSARMQCLRDAKADNKKSLTAARQAYDKAREAEKKAAATTATVAPVSTAAVPVAAKATTSTAKAPACADCGKITSVRVIEKAGESTPLGMIAGGVAGALLGHQVGDGKGKDVATIAGAAGGAYAGHKIEQSMKKTKSWVVTVHFDDGSDREFSFPTDPGFASGDPVRSSGGSVVRR